MSTRLVLATTIFVALSASGFAQGVDGVLITDQKAMAGNVTTGDGPGYPVTISLPGLYKLAGNLDVRPAGVFGNNKTGILVTVPDVTIDFNGYRLHAFGRAFTEGIRSLQPSITIRNGTIAGFTATGILSLGSTWIIEDMRIANNLVGIEASNSNRTIVRNNEIASNGTGMYCGVSCLVEGNVISSNGNEGLFIFSGLVIGNSIFSNGRAGIYNLGGGSDVGATGNVLFGNNPNLFGGVTGTDKNLCNGVIC